ncbi:replication initiation protein [Polaribacter phage P12002L]|uniref:Chromosome replication initiation protein DnaA n=2 Tax=Incheonvirus TaxID=2976977 RepID=A0A0F7DD28_9CAUD|nr:replication initiation protein [Polaribacter phage P12002S]YP_009209706.1 replication initiation protein [Polaribacter phage P12002L]AKG94220.1 chromosome replication initiation protein DnaA [Polaribacter phage P12002L]AKG94301.1 chromosome replication initiation protein DnaA [Polaribacter phage P12002S]
MENNITKMLTLQEKRDKAKLIIKLVNNYFSVECNVKYRNDSVVLPRQIAIYLIHRNIVLSLAEIGKLFVSRKNTHLDHSTIIHNKNKVISWLSINDKSVVSHVDNLKNDAELISKFTPLEVEKIKIQDEILELIKNYSKSDLILLKQELDKKDFYESIK